MTADRALNKMNWWMKWNEMISRNERMIPFLCFVFYFTISSRSLVLTLAMMSACLTYVSLVANSGFLLWYRRNGCLRCFHLSIRSQNVLQLHTRDPQHSCATHIDNTFKLCPTEEEMSSPTKMDEGRIHELMMYSKFLPLFLFCGALDCGTPRQRKRGERGK